MFRLCAGDTPNYGYDATGFDGERFAANAEKERIHDMYKLL